MKRTNLVSLALAAALLGAMSPAAANAQAPDAARFRGQSGDKWWDPQAQSQSQGQRGWHQGNADFEGRWVAQSRDDSRFGNGNGNGAWGGNGDGAYGGGDNGASGGNGAYGRGDQNGAFGRGADNRFGGGYGRGMTLPDFLLIDQQRRLIRIADRGNHMVQMIALDRGYRDREGNAFLSGQINGNRLVAQGVDARGRQMTQTMFLRDRGQTLVVRTQVERGRSGRMVETEKVYQRA